MLKEEIVQLERHCVSHLILNTRRLENDKYGDKPGEKKKNNQGNIGKHRPVNLQAN